MKRPHLKLLKGGKGQMEFELSVTDRIMILNVLPQKGNFLDLRVAKDLAELVGFSAEEQEQRGFREDEDKESPTHGQLFWADPSPITVDISPKSVELIRKQLKALNDKNELDKQLMGICEIFEFDGS